VDCMISRGNWRIREEERASTIKTSSNAVSKPLWCAESACTIHLSRMGKAFPKIYRISMRKAPSLQSAMPSVSWLRKYFRSSWIDDWKSV
jgi:hypothetical protein